MDKAIEAAARVIDPLAFQEQGSCPPRGYEFHSPEELSRVIAARRNHALKVAKRMIDAYLAASGLAEERVVIDNRHPDCHKAADAFWEYWNENGETHKRGYYESTWGAINAALRLVGVRKAAGG